MAQKDYYHILELKYGCTEQQIKNNYKKLAMKHHPDRGGDMESFKKINEAYSVLTDPTLKEQYDSRYVYQDIKTFSLPITFKESITGVKVNTHLGIVDVPSGVWNGAKIRYLDNIIEVKVEPNPIYNREGGDLYRVLEVSSLTAITGGDILIKNAIDEDITINIPSLMKNNTVIKVIGQGIPCLKGNMYIKCIIETPILTQDIIDGIIAITKSK